MTSEKKLKEFRQVLLDLHLLYRCLGSKGRNRWKKPQDIFVFNCNYLTLAGEKFGHGDVNITEDEEKLKEVAAKIGEPFLILYESGARFDTEEKPKLAEAVCTVFANSEIVFNEKLNIVRNAEGKLVHKKEKVKKVKVTPQHYEEAEFKAYKLPKIKGIKGSSPVEQLQLAIAKKLGVDPKEYNTGCLHLTAKQDALLKKEFKAWVKKEHKYIDAYEINKAWMYHHLDLGPLQFMGTPKWHKGEDYAYVKLARIKIDR